MAQSFKGLNLDQLLEQRTLLIGPNGSGKSARTQALMLAVMGYIPGSDKTNAGILETFGAGDKLVVGFEVDGKLKFERGFVRLGDKVSQGYKIGGAKKSKEDFARALGGANIRLVDVTEAFTSLSDQKQMDVIFGLYPPAGDLSAIIEQIEKEKTSLNALNAKIRDTEGAAQRITAARSAMQLPAGTLAETNEHLDKIEGQIDEARKALKAAEIEEARLQAQEEEKKRILAEQERKEKEKKEADELKAKEEKEAAEEKAKEERERLEEEARQKAVDEAVEKGPPTPWAVEQEKNLDRMERDAQTMQTLAKPMTFYPVPQDQPPSNGATTSIRAIITALEGAGCDTCAALMVAKRELRKYRQEVA